MIIIYHVSPNQCFWTDLFLQSKSDNDFSLVSDVFTKIDSIDFFLKGMWAAKKQHTQIWYSMILQNKTAMVVSRHLIKKKHKYMSIGNLCNVFFFY